MKLPVALIVDFFRNLIDHEDRDQILRAILDKRTIKDSHHKGIAFENLVREIAHGLQIVVDDSVGREDMILNGKRVQAKWIDELRGRQVPIDNMRPVKQNDGRRGYLLSEIDVFILKHRHQIYVIPSSRIAGADGMLLSRIDPSEYKDCIDNWSVFDEMGPHGEGQHVLF